MGKTIEGVVDARASEAQAAIGRPTEGIPIEGAPTPPAPFYFREVIHTQVRSAFAKDGSLTRTGIQIIERISEGGTWPDDLFRFQGLGKLQAQTPRGNVVRDYRFDVPALTIEEAWANHDGAATRAHAQQTQLFREAYAAEERQIAVPTPAQASKLLGADGKPV